MGTQFFEICYICHMKSLIRTIQKEVGKWLMDVAKYIATAVVITSIFGGMVNKGWVVAVGLIAIILMLVCGVILIDQGKVEQEKKGE